MLPIQQQITPTPESSFNQFSISPKKCNQEFITHSTS